MIDVTQKVKTKNKSDVPDLPKPEEMLAHALKFSFGTARERLDIECRSGNPAEPGSRWAVVMGGSNVLNSRGEWEYEPSPSGRDKRFLKRTRFDLKTAWHMAEEVAKESKLIDEAMKDIKLDRKNGEGS